MVDGKERCFWHSAWNSNTLPSTIYYLPSPIPSGLVSDLLPVSQLPNGVVRLLDLGRLLQDQGTDSCVECGVLQRGLVGGLGHVFTALGLDNNPMIDLGAAAAVLLAGNRPAGTPATPANNRIFQPATSRVRAAASCGCASSS